MKQLYKTENNFLNFKGKTTKKINIFLTREENNFFNELKYKYRLSFTFMANIIVHHYIKYNDLINTCMTSQLYKTKNKKTSIKIINLFGEGNKVENAKVFNNAMVMFANQLDKQIIIKEKEYNKLRNDIYTMFQNVNDDFYNYNQNFRQYYYMQKYLKKS